MGSTYRYLAIDDEADAVDRWFRADNASPVVEETERGHVVWFRDFGDLVRSDGDIDAKKSPVVTLFDPRLRRGRLWTVGEVHFLPTRGRFPELDSVRRRFAGWIGGFEEVYATGIEGPWDYYLEGSVRNYDTPITQCR